ncbi:MAG: NAD(P)/FAD-dependent oxidoreductase [Pseudomonadota bacterium]
MEHRLVIVGGGAGGLELATRLGRRYRKTNIQVTLVDANLTHIWKPLLHEVAAGTINSYEDELNYFGHAAKNNFEFQLGRLQAVDRDNNTISLQEITGNNAEVIANARTISYDTLVLAIGSQANDFNTPGAEENCVFIDSRQEAERFHQAFLGAYLRAHGQEEEQSLNIAIVGAGATGVELAAELTQAAKEFIRYGLRGLKPTNVSISLIEAGPSILPVLPARVAQAAHKQLESLGVKVLTDTRVAKITEDGLETDDGTVIPAVLKAWSAGIKAPALLADIEGLESNRINQLVVTPTLQTTQDASIFAMGDCSSYTPEGEERAIPPKAQAAHQQASFLYNALHQHVHQKPLGHFVYSDKGSLISLSKEGTVGILGSSINVRGKLARLVYVSLYRMHQYALHGMVRTSLLLVRDLFARGSKPTLKLH